jgi:hypothetical protein
LGRFRAANSQRAFLASVVTGKGKNDSGDKVCEIAVMTIDVPDEYLPLIIKALDNQHVASKVLNRQDDRYRDISMLFKNAVERKGPGREEGAGQKKRRKA